MAGSIARLLVCAVIAWQATASAANPVKLKLSFYSSDSSFNYRLEVKPFVDAVNFAGQGIVEIQPYFSGALGKDLRQQPQMVRDGTADLAAVVPGLTRELFPDNIVIEMPGMYRDIREASLVFTALTAAGKLRGYEDFYIVSAYATPPETIHSRLPLTTLDGLKGKRIRVNNPGEAAGLEKLGAKPVYIPVTLIANALSSGEIDATLVAPSPLVDYGIRRIATYHYMLGVSVAPLLILMNRKVFDSLPKPAQDIIRKYSGPWPIERLVEFREPIERDIVEQLKTDKGRHFIVPSAADRARAEAAFQEVRHEWAATEPRNAQLLKDAEAELAKVRGSR